VPGRLSSATRGRSQVSFGRTAFRPGRKGRFTPFIPYFWGIWSFGRNKPAAKSLLTHLSQPTAIPPSEGFDIPSFELTTLETCAEAEPPKGTSSICHHDAFESYRVVLLYAVEIDRVHRRRLTGAKWIEWAAGPP
jgi:hypothetical protein